MTGLELKMLRDSKKLRVQEYADMLGIGRSTLLKYESMDEVPAYIMYATYYLLGHLAIEYVTMERAKKTGSKLRIDANDVEVGAVKKALQAKVKGRLAKTLPPDTNTYRYE